MRRFANIGRREVTSLPTPPEYDMTPEQLAQKKKEEAKNGAASDGDGRISSSYGENVVVVSNQELALRVATFHRCVSLRANTMAQLTCQYQRLNRDGGNFIQDNYGKAGEINYLLQRRPNPMMTAFEMWRQTELETIFRGNAFILVDRDEDGWPRAFWLAGCAGYNQVDDTYTLTWNEPGGVMSGVFSSADVIHIANTFRPYGGLMGIPLLQFARDTLSLNATLAKESLESAGKGGKVKLILQQEKQGSFGLNGGLVKKQQIVKYAQEVEDAIYSHDVIGLHGITNVSPISMNANEMQLFEQRQFGVPEICRLLDVPRSLAMDGSNSSYKTPEADRLDFLMNCIQPKRRLIEDELNSKLLNRYDFGKRRIHLCELPLMMFDKKGQAQIDKMNLETGSMTVNEIRKQYDMPAVPDGDKVYISTNLAELGSDKLRGNSGGNPEPGGGSQGDDGAAPAAPKQQPAQEGGEE